MGEYIKSSIIKYTRKALGMTQEELAEAICDPVTLSRYENGKLNPTDDNFVRLMKKMGEKADCLLTPLKGEAVRKEKILEEILYAMERKDWEKAECLRQEIEKPDNSFMHYPENVQYMKRIEAMVRYEKGEISKSEALSDLLEILKLTFGEIGLDDFWEKRVLREPEFLVLFDIATLYSEMGEIDRSVYIFNKLDQYLRRKDMINDGKPRYLVYLEYSNVLGINGYHDESIEICKREIQWLCENNKTNFLYNFYFNIGWNIQKKIEKGLENKMRIPEAKAYVWLAYCLCNEYPENKKNLEIIQKFYSTMMD